MFFHNSFVNAIVTEYQIEADDTLNGLLLAEVAFGHGFVSLLHQRGANPPTCIPTNDILLTIGDRLTVLGTTESLPHLYGKTLQL